MNFNLYLFGTPQGRYSQYPNDYIADVISPLQRSVKGSQLVIVRKNDLVHYIFTESLGGDSTVGLCIVFNKARIEKPGRLIELFQYIVETRMVEQGRIIRYDNHGHLVYTVNSMAECGTEYDKLQEYVNEELETNPGKYGIKPLLSIFDGTNTVATVDQSASDARIVQLTTVHNRVIVNLDEGVRHGYIEQIMESLGQMNEALKMENTSLKEKVEGLSKQKKQYRVVIVLSVMMLLGAIIAVAAVSGKNREINDQLLRIETLEGTVSDKNDRIRTLKDDLKSLESKYNSVTEVYPLTITNIEIAITDYGGNIQTDYGNTLYSYNTMYLKPKIYYRGYNSGSKDLKVKWYKPSGEVSRGSSSPAEFSQIDTYNISKGKNEMTLVGWGGTDKGHWRSGTYRIEIWYEDVCLKSKKFTIY